MGVEVVIAAAAGLVVGILLVMVFNAILRARRSDAEVAQDMAAFKVELAARVNHFRQLGVPIKGEVRVDE